MTKERAELPGLMEKKRERFPCPYKKNRGPRKKEGSRWTRVCEKKGGTEPTQGKKGE